MNKKQKSEFHRKVFHDQQGRQRQARASVILTMGELEFALLDGDEGLVALCAGDAAAAEMLMLRALGRVTALIDMMRDDLGITTLPLREVAR